MSDHKENKNQENKNSFLNTFMERMQKDKMFARYVYGGVLIVVLVIIIVVCVAFSKGGDTKEQKAEATTQEAEGTSEEATSENTTLDTSLTDTFVDDGSLQENAYEEVNSLVAAYFTAQAAGDRDTIASLKSDTTEEELVKIEKKSAYIEGFENIAVYTKLGNVENSYIAFVYYDINFAGVDTLAPGLTTLYICPNAEGALHIYDGDLDADTSERIKAAAAESDVVDLFNRVEVAYNEAVEADAALKTFMDELPAKLDTEVAEALAAASAEQAAADAEQAVAEEPAAEEAAPVTETVQANDTVNVRSSDSENADKLGKLDVGTQVTRYEAKENGWSRIDYNGTEGFVKSEFLTVVEAGTEAAVTESETETTTEDAASVETQGTVTIKETVNVRKSASETGDKLGVAYQGEHYDLVMKQADGWTKIMFNGSVGFVKSDFLED